ncbi:MAG: 50S ribosomal protein L11 methyltransferase [Myxococcota bacterium]
MPEETTTNVAFTPYEISLCLHDVARTRMWKEAIEDVVQPGDVVIDAGSGTGILGVFAALAGAKKVYCIELHPRFVTLIQHLAERNNVAHIIEVIHADATTVAIPEAADVLICELLCTGQFFEPEVQVVNHLRQFLKPDAAVVPREIRSFVRLLDAQEQLYDVRIDCDSRSVVLDSDEPVSDRVLYDRIDFTLPGDRPLLVDTSVELVARKTRLADAVLIEGEADLSEQITTRPTRFLYNPEVIFLQHPKELTQGQRVRLDIRYPYGGDTLDALFNVTPT